MTSLWFQSFLLPDGWAQRVRIDIVNGRIHSIESGVSPDPDAEQHSIGVPGLPNVHSHAFQRAMAGRCELPGPTGDNFWSWRETMYRFVDAIGRDDLEALIDREVDVHNGINLAEDQRMPQLPQAKPDTAKVFRFPPIL